MRTKVTCDKWNAKTIVHELRSTRATSQNVLYQTSKYRSDLLKLVSSYAIECCLNRKCLWDFTSFKDVLMKSANEQRSQRSFGLWSNGAKFRGLFVTAHHFFNCHQNKNKIKKKTLQGRNETSHLWNELLGWNRLRHDTITINKIMCIDLNGALKVQIILKLVLGQNA